MGSASTKWGRKATGTAADRGGRAFFVPASSCLAQTGFRQIACQVRRAASQAAKLKCQVINSECQVINQDSAMLAGHIDRGARHSHDA